MDTDAHIHGRNHKETYIYFIFFKLLHIPKVPLEKSKTVGPDAKVKISRFLSQIKIKKCYVSNYKTKKHHSGGYKPEHHLGL